MDKLSQRNNIFILVDWNACLPRQFSRVRLFATLWTVACQSLLSMGILQAIILEWVAMLSSKGSSWPWHHSHVFCLLHWQVGSLSLVPPGKSPEQYFSSYLSLKKKNKKQKKNSFPPLTLCYKVFKMLTLKFCTYLVRLWTTTSLQTISWVALV